MKLKVFSLGILFIGWCSPLNGEEEPGWYRFEFQAGNSLEARLVGEEKDSYIILYEGSILQVVKKDLKGMRRVESSEGPPKDREASGQLEALYRNAIEDLALPTGPRSAKAIQLLATELAKARTLLHKALQHSSPIVRARAVKLLGEKGSAPEDLDPVADRLTDSNPMVRLAAVMAVRTLGPKGLPALRDYLESEPVANNRKMAVKTLHIWKDPRAVEPLVRLLELEKDAGVRDFLERALEDLTGQKLGQDPRAWRGYLEQEESRDEVEKIYRSGEGRTGNGDRSAKEEEAQEREGESRESGKTGLSGKGA